MYQIDTYWSNIQRSSIIFISDIILFLKFSIRPRLFFVFQISEILSKAFEQERRDSCYVCGLVDASCDYHAPTVDSACIAALIDVCVIPGSSVKYESQKHFNKTLEEILYKISDRCHTQRINIKANIKSHHFLWKVRVL